MGFQYSQTIADLFSLWPQITGKAQYLWMEGAQRIFKICCTIWWCCSRRQHCGADLQSICILSGNFQNFNPHLHAIVSDGCFLDDGNFSTAPGFMLEDLEKAFQYEVIPPRTGSPGKFLMLWIGLLNWWLTFPVDMSRLSGTTVSIRTNPGAWEKRLIPMMVFRLSYRVQCLPKNSGKIGLD